MDRPALAITMGDPAGVGAEIIVKAFARADEALPLVIGSVACLERAMRETGCRHGLTRVPAPDAVAGRADAIRVYEPVPFCADDLVMGRVSAACGEAAVKYFEAAVRLCLENRLDGIVTCPINKEAVQAAGYVGDLGHQEILARLTGSRLTATMLMTGRLKVAHLSTHKSLAEAVKYVRKPVIVDKLKLTVASLQSWGIPAPTVAVAALNPHGGEGGMLGREEIEQIGPAVAACRAQGLSVQGPFPADSVFYRAIAGEFDAVLALYHDQGHIAVKVHNFADSVTATMGIPFIRTSVDHGTAFDIAGRNRADASGLVAALRTAVAMRNQSL